MAYASPYAKPMHNRYRSMTDCRGGVPTPATNTSFEGSEDSKYSNSREEHEDFEQFWRYRDADEFYMNRYKTVFCPMKNKKHDWSSCIYAHRMQDFRRKPDKHFYYPEACPHQNF